MTHLSKEELRKQIIKEMCLEEDLLGQLVLKDYEDLVSDWKICVDNIMALLDRYSKQREVEARIDEIEWGYGNSSEEEVSHNYWFERLKELKASLAALSVPSEEESDES